MKAALGAVILVVALTACSDNGSDGDDTGGSGSTAGTSAGTGGATAGTGGSSGGSTSKGGSTSGGGSTSSGGSTSGGGSSGGTAGSSGGSASVVRGAVSLNILAPAGCSLTEQYQDFPKVASGHPVTATEKGAGIADGEMTEDFPADVLCEWLGFEIDAVIRLGPAGNQRLINIGSSLVVGESAQNGVVLNSVELPAQYGGDCMVTPIEVDMATRSVWSSFTCETFDTFDDTDHCAIGPSYLFFENCTAP
jgi:hypothetical protein